ncbi:MAG: hypothetical protein RBT76_01280 [candidate division Zixibacteria bacterium]|jgi:type II secretory pathway pseudopilin PulG|nr:hypothetical protein [candidate division Zixibacteria bacterium]
MIRRAEFQRGFTVVELVIIIVTIGILATIATRQLQPSIETARFEQTKLEMEQLAWAIAGNPEVRTSGARTDFGYVGDIGALPATLEVLVSNPASFPNWKGPYIEPGINGWEYRRDAWGTDYTLSGTVLRSTGSGQTIEKVICAQAAELTSNDVRGMLLNADGSMPGPVWSDSVMLRLIHPNGAGALVASVTAPAPDGSFSFAGVPVGNHCLQMIYTPSGDTLSYSVCVQPGRTTRVELISPIDLW